MANIINNGGRRPYQLRGAAQQWFWDSRRCDDAPRRPTTRRVATDDLPGSVELSIYHYSPRAGTEARYAASCWRRRIALVEGLPTLGPFQKYLLSKRI